MTTKDKELRRKTYERQSICPHTRLHKLVDVPIFHPVRNHRESILGNRHTQQWQHVRVMKVLPSYYFLTEPLYGIWSVRRHAQAEGGPLLRSAPGRLWNISPWP